MLILFDGEKERLGRLIRITDTLNLLKTNYLLITPKLPENISKRVKGDVIQIQNGLDPLITVNYLILNAITSLSNKCIAKKRCVRLNEELNDMPKIVEDLINYYEKIVTELVTSLKDTKQDKLAVGVISTPSLQLVAEVLSDLLINSGYLPIQLTLYTNISTLQQYVKLIISLITDVEESYSKEVLPPIFIKIPYREVRIKTDPLTASMYGLIILKALRHKLKASV